jgi:hypothetical protein
MVHRHLRPDVALGEPALDDLVARGSWAEWGALRDRLAGSATLRQRLHRLCTDRLRDVEAPTARYRAWLAFLALAESDG